MKSVYAKQLYTGRSVQTDVFLAFAGHMISSVSKRRKGELIGEYPVVTPAFIDPHSHIGLHRAGEPGGEGDANDRYDALLALPDALDAIQMDDTAFRDAIEMGVLYSCVVPGSGNIIGGQAAVIRNYGINSSQALIARAGVKAAFGYNPKSTTDWKGNRPTTRMGTTALLRGKFDEVRQKIQRYRAAGEKKKKEMTFSIEDKVYRDLMEGRIRMRAHVHKIDDIAAILRLVDEFHLNVSVEHASDVYRPEIFRELKKRGIPVVYGPIDSFAYKVELKNESWRNINCLIESGVKFGLMTDHPVVLTRQLFLQTRWFLRAGWSPQQAVELVSRHNAEILGLDSILGTLAKGKWASFVGWNADPFHLASYPAAVYGEGELLHSEEAALKRKRFPVRN
jgi:imidazolonepropionase-like amidohydrolase